MTDIKISLYWLNIFFPLQTSSHSLLPFPMKFITVSRSGTPVWGRMTQNPHRSKRNNRSSDSVRRTHLSPHIITKTKLWMMERGGHKLYYYTECNNSLKWIWNENNKWILRHWKFLNTSNFWIIMLFSGNWQQNKLSNVCWGEITSQY
jgi:hypothetical protein